MRIMEIPALRLQLKKILAEDEALTAELARLWEEAKAASVTATGNRSVVIGGSVIITRNKNRWSAELSADTFRLAVVLL